MSAWMMGDKQNCSSVFLWSKNIQLKHSVSVSRITCWFGFLIKFYFSLRLASSLEMETWFASERKTKQTPRQSRYLVMGLCCPASVCISILRETFNPKPLILTEWKEKQRNCSKQQFKQQYKLTSALCFKNPVQRVQEICKSSSKWSSSFCSPLFCLQVRASLQSLWRRGGVLCICTSCRQFSHHPTANTHPSFH